jgi:hypothetical protein
MRERVEAEDYIETLRAEIVTADVRAAELRGDVLVPRLLEHLRRKVYRDNAPRGDLAGQPRGDLSGTAPHFQQVFARRKLQQFAVRFELVNSRRRILAHRVPTRGQLVEERDPRVVRRR